MIPRLGEPYDPKQSYTLRPGAYVILPRGRDILLTAELGRSVDIQLPGGGLDPGESPISALHREVAEETGWRITRPIRFGAFRRFVFMPEYDLWAEKLCTVYVARPAFQLSDPLEAHHEPVWFDIDTALEALGNVGDRTMLSRFAVSSYPV